MIPSFKCAVGGRLPAKRILIADDEAPIRHLLRDYLESLGYEVVEATNGRDAFDRLAQCSPALAIVDLVMPEQEGIETIRQIRATHKEVKIVAVSGAFAGQFLRTAELLGANAVLPKPINLPELARITKRLIGDPGVSIKA
jgi:CheY-like chemotaxis protein